MIYISGAQDLYLLLREKKQEFHLEVEFDEPSFSSTTIFVSMMILPKVYRKLSKNLVSYNESVSYIINLKS